jgi:hypothetical protein
MSASEEKNYSLSLDQAELKDNYNLFQASLGQVMKQLKVMTVKQPLSEFDKVMFKFFTERKAVFVESFEKILNCESDEEYKVKSFNLIGNLPRGVMVPQKIKGHVKLCKARLGDLIATVYQRIQFIVTREVPSFYDNFPEMKNYFLKMQDEIKEFGCEVKSFEDDFIAAVDNAHKARRGSVGSM